ncbi:MAG TPA: hypothetical protein VLG37_00785 [Candidatus Saccharimonadales bacterium]|nr:hypothetical protein [Candidatus Saccharimonadales bacterium]
MQEQLSSLTDPDFDATFDAIFQPHARKVIPFEQTERPVAVALQERFGPGQEAWRQRVIGSLWRRIVAMDDSETRKALVGKGGRLDAFVDGVLRLKQAFPDLPDSQIHARFEAAALANPQATDAAQRLEISRQLLESDPTKPDEKPAYMFSAIQPIRSPHNLGIYFPAAV